MLKALWIMALLCLIVRTGAQTKYRSQTVKNKFGDSIQAAQLKEDMVYDLPIITVSENERSEATIPSLLSAGRDIFTGIASFHFNAVRFKIRGYDADLFNTQINGMHMNNPDDGNTEWGLWNGLNEVTRNTQMFQGYGAGEQSFGNIGNTIAIDMRASKQREQTQFSYAFSNRSYTHRWAFSKSAGFNRKGWAYAVSASWRYAAEGYMPGTDYKGGSYFIAIDKKLNDENVLSLLLFGNTAENGKQAPVLEESVGLSNGSFYNPSWGYQSGKKRNANVGRTHQPVIIFTDDFRINNQTSFTTTVGLQVGQKSSTSLDWYNAPDPRPDYYRYLPSYQPDSVLRAMETDAIKENSQLRQVNWDHLFDVNRNSHETINDANGMNGNSITGTHAHYIVEENVTALQRLDVSAVYNTRINDLAFSGGVNWQLQQTHHFKRVDDLLGADFFVDWNQFAERDFPNDRSVIQNDLNHPNRVLKTGDVYGYDYYVRTDRSALWAQLAGTKKHTDFFVATELVHTAFYRDGKMKNGLFRFNSFGKSKLDEFAGYALKAGLTYKISGRKYLYVQGIVLSRAPLFDNVFISPRTRDTQQENIKNEKILSAETGYVFNAPTIKLKIAAYLTQFLDGMNVITFYHDGYGNFVNYALSGIDKIHFGTELGLEWKMANHFTMTAAASIARYYYNSRQQVSVSADNDAYILEKAIIYSQNFRVGGTPQEAYGLGMGYQSAGSVYVNLSANYFRQEWLDFNPLRRTYAALENVTAGSEQWNKIINQTLLPQEYTVDLSGGTSAKLKLFHSKHRHTLLLNVSINNLLNKKNIISGGYEQLRFDTETKNTDKFPPKYFYALGLNFSVNTSLRL